MIWNTIFYLVKTGCQWRMLPKDFPKWELAYYYYRKRASLDEFDLPLERLSGSMRVRTVLSISCNFMKYFISILLTMIAPLFACSQTSENKLVRVTGRVVDVVHVPIEYANAVLFSMVDSSYIEGTISDSTGAFELNLDKTYHCYLKISFVGYEDFYHDCSSGDIGIVILKKQTQMLEEVVVSSNIPVTKLKNNALVTRVENSILAKIGTANDVLSRTPGVIEKNGTFDVFGKGTPVIFINGKQVRDNSELDKLSSENIKNIEVIANPGAQYDASVNSVIRIRTKKNVGDGFGLSINAINKISRYYNGDYQADFNYRHKSLDIFGYLSTGFGKNRYGTIVEQQTTVDTLWLLKTVSSEIERTKNYSGKLGFNYEFNENHSIGAHYQSSYKLKNGTGINNSDVYSDGVFYDTWNSNSQSKQKDYPYDEANCYYSGSINKLSIDLNLDYLSFITKSDLFQLERSVNYEDRSVTTNSANNNQLYAAKIIFSYPIFNGKISLGEESTFTKRSNRFINVDHILPNNENEIKENNFATFIEHTQPIGNWNLNVGLRFEHADFNYFINNTKQSDQSKIYNNIFPSASFSGSFGKTDLSVSYSSRIVRPTYSQLDGNLYYINRYHLLSGNPLLQPTKVNDLTAIFSYKWFQFMSSYEHANGEILYITKDYQKDSKVSYVTYENYDKLDKLTLFASMSPTIGFWKPQLSIGLLKQWFCGTYLNEKKTFNNPIPIIQFYNSFKLPSDFILRVDSYFQGEGNFQNISLNNQFKVDLSLGKTLFNNNLTINIACKDVFDTYKHTPTLYNNNILIKQENIVDTRSLNISLRYRFNAVKAKYKGTGSGQAEKNRL